MKLPHALQEAVRQEGRDLALLVVRLGALGDILRTLPPARLLRRSLPEARIGWVCDDRWCRILEGHPDFDEIVALPRRDLDRLLGSPLGWGQALRAVRDLRTLLRGYGYDAALDFQGNLRSGLVARLSGAPVRLGYSGHQQKEGNRAFTTHRVEPGPRRRSRMDRNLDLVRALGVPDASLPDAGLPEPPADAATAEAIVRDALGGTRRFAVLSPGASARQSYKRPPVDLLAAAAWTLGDLGTKALVTWGPGERDDADAVVARAGGKAVPAPETTLGVLASLLRRASLFVGGDSGPLHLACATGCPVVGLYGPTDPVVNAPWGVPHAALHPPDRRYTGIKRVDRASGGFDGLEASAVREAVGRLLRRVPD